MEFLSDRNCPEPAVAEIAGKEVSEPVNISGQNTLVHAVHGCELLHPFLIALGVGLHALLLSNCLYVRGRQAAEKGVYYQHNKEEDDY